MIELMIYYVELGVDLLTIMVICMNHFIIVWSPCIKMVK